MTEKQGRASATQVKGSHTQYCTLDKCVCFEVAKLTKAQEKRFDEDLTEIAYSEFGRATVMIKDSTKVKQHLADELVMERKKMVEEMYEYNNRLYKDDAWMFVNTFLGIFKEHLKLKTKQLKQ